MWRIRCFEERVGQLKRSMQVHGLIHLSIGGEGVAAGVCRQLRDDDAVYSGHRAHGHAIAKGAPLGRVMAELMGRSDGLCRGLGGSMHLVDTRARTDRARPASSAATSRSRSATRSPRGCAAATEVTVVFFGDGAVQAGHFHESVNLAALWELPVILVCENNGFAEFTPRSAHTPVERVSDVVAPYGFARADRRRQRRRRGVRGVRRVSRRRARRARPDAARVPDPPPPRPLRGRRERYRDALADEEWAQLDPIARLEQRALGEGWIDRTTLAAVRDAARAEVDAAVAFARESPFPEPSWPPSWSTRR